MNVFIMIVIAMGLCLYAVYELALRGRHGNTHRLREPSASRVPSPAAPLSARLILMLLPVWLLIALWETNPLYQHLASAIPAGFDSATFAWNLWWMKFALLHLHQFPFFTNYIFAPQQVNLAFQTFTPLNGLLSIPLQLLFGLNAALDLLLLANLVVASLGAFLLVYQETGSKTSALVGSVITPYAPYVMANLNAGHFHIVTTWPVPFYALFLLRWLRRVALLHPPRSNPDMATLALPSGGRASVLREAALAGLFLGCIGLNDLDQLSFCISFGALVVVYSLWRRVRNEWSSAGLKQWATGLVVMSGVSLVVFLPEFVPFLIGLSQGWNTGTPLETSDAFAPDLTGYITPLYLHPLWGQWAAQVAFSNHGLDQPKVVFLGYTTLILALLSLARLGWRNVRLWWCVALFFWLLTIGPHLHLFGASTFTLAGTTFQIPLPYMLYHQIPLLGGGRIPSYASVITALCLAVLAGHGVAVIGRWVPRYVTPMIAVVAALLILFESLSTPLPLLGIRIDPVYAQLAREPGDKAILLAPVGWRDGRIGLGNIDGQEMYYITAAEKPMVNGAGGRIPDRYFDYYGQQPALAELITPEAPPTPASQNRQLVRAALHTMNVGYIVVNQFPDYDKIVEYIQHVIDATVMYKDANVIAFRLLMACHEATVAWACRV